MVCGGADNLAGAAIASAVEVTGAPLVDGDSSAGVMRPTGQGRARCPDARPVLVSVALAGLVTYPGACQENRTGEIVWPVSHVS